jgi:hypothetical protein
MISKMQASRVPSWLLFIGISGIPVIVEGLFTAHTLLNSKPFRETTINGEPVFKALAYAAMLLMPIAAVTISCALMRKRMLMGPIVAALVGSLLLLVFFWLFTPSPAQMPDVTVPVSDDVIVKTPKIKLIEARSEFGSRLAAIGGVGMFFGVVAASALYMLRRRERMRIDGGAAHL